MSGSGGRGSGGQGWGGGRGWGRGGGRGHRGRRGFDSRGDFFDDGFSGEAHHSRFDPYRGRKNTRGRNNKHRHKNDRNSASMDFINNGPLWFKVQIPVGKRLGKEWILRVLNEVTPTRFNPYNFSFDNNSAIFYVDNVETANVIRAQNRRIETPQGFHMSLVVSRTPPPQPLPLEGEALECLKVTMSGRYRPEQNLLNLSGFHHDPQLKGKGLYLPLHRPKVFDAALKIIKENIPQLEALDLADNKILHLNMMAPLLAQCKQLKSLSLKNNILSSMSDLNPLKGYDSIEELILQGNPLADEFKNKHSSYVSAVRERFPKVLKLDGQDLAPPIVFDLGCAEVVPTIKGNFFPSSDAQRLVVKFLESYYMMYDSPNRQGLLEAYHDEALYSLTCLKTALKGAAYFLKSRNLLKGDENDQRSNLHSGKLDIVALLNKLPLTNHDPNSMTIDIAHVSSTLMMFTVMGVFKEVNDNGQVGSFLRNFSRAFTVVPVADQREIVIINDTHYIGNATPDQIKASKSNSKSQSTPSGGGSSRVGGSHAPSSLLAPTSSSSPAVIPHHPSKSEAELQQQRRLVVMQLSQMSGMNLPFSVRCLEENNWDLNLAFNVYEQLKIDGGIPPEAFAK